MGTEDGGSSLIGDGLASCVLRFDRLDEERARSIVFATDNASGRRSDRVAAQTPRRWPERRTSGCTPWRRPTTSRPTTRAELEAAVALTGGAYLTTDDDRVVDHVIARIVAEEATHLEQPPEVVRDDRPTTWAAIALAGVGLLGLVTWMLRR